MIAVDPATLADWTGGRLVPSAAAGHVRGVSIDTRTLAPGNLFVALRGPRFDGHDFAATALEIGASALLVERDMPLDCPRIVVPDSRAALGAIGARWRSRFDIPVIAVTGSNGKTTVKECLAAILRRQGPTLATRGNLNNDIGVPLMLCELDDDHAAAVLELGANHPGEIAALSALVRPAVGVLTNAAAAHLEGFGSVAGVARAKGELLAALPPDGRAVFPAASEWTDLWNDLAGAEIRITFGEDRAAMVRVAPAAAGEIELSVGDRRRRLRFGLPGAHNRHNAAAAAAGAWAVDVPLDTIAEGLADVEPVAGRLVERRATAGGRLLDDSYNANPGSFAAAFAVLSEADGRRWAVIGEMAELGAMAAEAHERLGSEAREAGIERLWAYGPSADCTVRGFGAGAEVVIDLDALAAELGRTTDADVTLLIKGSRSNALERLVDRLVTGDHEDRVTTGMGD